MKIYVGLAGLQTKYNPTEIISWPIGEIFCRIECDYSSTDPKDHYINWPTDPKELSTDRPADHKDQSIYGPTDPEE